VCFGVFVCVCVFVCVFVYACVRVCVYVCCTRGFLCALAVTVGVYFFCFVLICIILLEILLCAINMLSSLLLMLCGGVRLH